MYHVLIAVQGDTGHFLHGHMLVFHDYLEFDAVYTKNLAPFQKCKKEKKEVSLSLFFVCLLLRYQFKKIHVYSIYLCIYNIIYSVGIPNVCVMQCFFFYIIIILYS